MKRCPKCNADYFDNVLEFCLEDGTRLAALPQPTASTAAAVRQTAGPAGPHAPIAVRDSEETVVLQNRDELASRGPAHEDAAASQASRVIETAPIVLALAHNWWQWLYLEKTYIYSIPEFLLSANFLMWLLMLGAGTAVGIYSLKTSKNKTFAIIGLVALAINLILFLVPRK